MYKIIYSLFAALLLFGSVEAMAEKKIALSPLQIHLMRTQPLEMGITVIREGVKGFNQQVDKTHANQPKERRPYITSRQMGMMFDDMLKKYHRGDRGPVLEVINLFEANLSNEEKVVLFETMVQAYLKSFPANSTAPQPYSPKLRN